MRFERLWAAVAMMSLAATLHAQVQTGSVANVNADGGYVALQNGRSGWQPMTSVASGATITLDTNAGEGDGGGGNGNSTQFKFNGPPSSPTPNTFSDSTSGAGGTSSTSGASKVATSSTAPTYYSASWGGTATSPPTSPPPGQISGTGTYDPWNVTYGSLYDLGAQPGDTVDLYYQTGLLATGVYGSTSAVAGPNGQAYYQFQTYAQSPSSFPFLLTVTYSAGSAPSFYLGTTSEFDVALLGANANDPNASPSDRMGANDAVQLNPNNIDSVLSPYFGADGTLSRDLDFGIVWHFLVPSLPSGGNRDDVLFGWHTDTLAGTQVAAVPEPGALAAFGLGVASLLRRRRRA